MATCPWHRSAQLELVASPQECAKQPHVLYCIERQETDTKSNVLEEHVRMTVLIGLLYAGVGNQFM